MSRRSNRFSFCLIFVVGLLNSCSSESGEADSFKTYCEEPLKSREVKRSSLATASNRCDFEAGTHSEPNPLNVHRQISEIDHKAGITSCRAAVGASPGSSRLKFQLARSLLAATVQPRHVQVKSDTREESRFDEDSSTFYEATEILSKLAETNHANAMALLGLIRRDKDMMLNAASFGSPTALGFQYFECTDNPKAPPKECFELGLKAHNAGHFTVGYEVAYVLAGFQHTKDSRQLIIDLLEGVAESDNPFALNALMTIYGDEEPFENGSRFVSIRLSDKAKFEHWLVRKIKSGRFPYRDQFVKHFESSFPRDPECRNKISQQVASSN